MLSKFYEKLYFSLKEKKVKEFPVNDTISLHFVKNVNKRGYDKIVKQLFHEKSVCIHFNTQHKADRDEIKRLEKAGFIMECTSPDLPNSFHITFKGIIEYEKEKFTEIYEMITNEIDKILFQEVKYTLNDKEKIICYFLLVLGRISKDNPFKLDRSKEDLAMKHFKQIQDVLLEFGIIDKELDWTISGNSNAFKFFSKIVQLNKTPIYKFSKGGPWFLDLSNERRKQIFRELFLVKFDRTKKYDFQQNISRISAGFCIDYGYPITDLSWFKNLI